MKKTLFLCLALAFTAASCTKSEQDIALPNKPADRNLNVDVIDAIVPNDIITATLTEFQADTAYRHIEPCGLWTKEEWSYAVTKLTDPDERFAYLTANMTAGARNNEPNMETIVRRNTSTNNSINGGAASWDCSPTLLAFTISQLGQPQALRSSYNYLNSGTSATRVTLSDVLRAANGLSDTSQDSVVEILDVVYEFQVSGDCNWLVGAVVSYDGSEYVYSNFTEASTLGPLVYDPEGSGMFIVGPMPGGVTSVSIDNQFDAPPCDL